VLVGRVHSSGNNLERIVVYGHAIGALYAVWSDVWPGAPRGNSAVCHGLYVVPINQVCIPRSAGASIDGAISSRLLETAVADFQCCSIVQSDGIVVVRKRQVVERQTRPASRDTVRAIAVIDVAEIDQPDMVHPGIVAVEGNVILVYGNRRAR